MGVLLFSYFNCGISAVIYMITQIRKENIRFRWKRRNSDGKVFYTLTAIVWLNSRKAVKVVLDEMDFTEHKHELLSHKQAEEEKLTVKILNNQEKLWTV